jgi:putative ABC transport system permease protein
MQDFTLLNVDSLPLTLGIIGIAIAISLWQKLELEGQFFFAASRALLQLLIVGYLLGFVFALKNPWGVLITLGAMLTIASIVTRNRIDRQLQGLLPLTIASILASSLFTLSYVILLILQPPNWYEPQYLIPLGGMILGNASNAASLAGERLKSAIANNRLEIETHLSLGATPQQAISKYRQEAIRIGLIPILNQMMIAGLVTLPSTLTGQLLSGMDPLNAASYQILILFVISLTDLIAVLGICEGLYRQFFNRDYQLIDNLDRS